jgi:hypothetical protein
VVTGFWCPLIQAFLKGFSLCWMGFYSIKNLLEFWFFIKRIRTVSLPVPLAHTLANQEFGTGPGFPKQIQF